MPIFDQLQRASFDGVAFPVEEVEVEGTLRDHVHEYPHSPGGAPEKEGRRLYVVRMQASFLDIWKDYPGLWPDGLARIRAKYEGEKSGDLLIPTIGTITAYITSFRQRMVARQRSGEKVELAFREDQSNQFLADALTAEVGASLALKAQRLRLEVGSLDESLPRGMLPPEGAPSPGSIFDTINDAVNAVLAIRDQAELAGNLLEQRLLWLAGICDEADKTLLFLQNPINHRVTDALHELWDSALTLSSDLQGKRSPMATYVVPLTMAVGDISRALYGDASRGVELMQLNPLDDPFRVPAGTTLKYYTAG
jgi:prophage DNA circulation protein